jgi:hypothetical protein
MRSGAYDLVVVGAHIANRRPLSHLSIPALVVPGEDARAPARSRPARPLIRG